MRTIRGVVVPKAGASDPCTHKGQEDGLLSIWRHFYDVHVVLQSGDRQVSAVTQIEVHSLRFPQMLGQSIQQKVAMGHA